MMKTLFSLILTLLLSISSAFAAKPAPKRVWPSDWHPTEICNTLTVGPNQFCQEVVKMDYVSTKPKQGTVVLIPGFFQNGAIFDLMPENGISFARYLMKEKGLQVYFLHVRGVGNSSVTSHYNLDTLAINDIPTALQYISEKENEKVFVMGHSQGGITLKASLSGLDHCGSLTCFNPTTALARQQYVRGILAIGANQSMSTRYHKNSLHFLGEFGWLTHSILDKTLDYIPAQQLIEKLSCEKNLLGNGTVWDFLYSTKEVSDDIKQAVYENTFDGSSVGIITQYADGIDHQGLRDSSGELFVDALKNIQIPVGEVAFDLDYFSPPREDYEDSFLKLDPKFRNFYQFPSKKYKVPSQRHEDFMLMPELFSEFSDPVDWLLDQR